MRLLNNAWAYVWRKKFKTLIIFLILLVMSTVSLSSLAVKRATDVASKETFKGISSSFSMDKAIAEQPEYVVFNGHGPTAGVGTCVVRTSRPFKA